MMLAYACASERFVTPAQVAAQTNTSESLWRNRAAAGSIPGAIKAGKQWLLPRDVLSLCYGVALPYDLFTETPQERADRWSGDTLPPEPPVEESPITNEEWEAALAQYMSMSGHVDGAEQED
jgi:hypothetical protein